MQSIGLRKRLYREPIRAKFLLLGDHSCGKTCLLTSVFIGPYEQCRYDPRAFASYIADVIVDDVAMEIVSCEAFTHTADDYFAIRTRSLAYYDSDVILFCFSIDSKLSLQNVETLWLAEIKLFQLENIPAILIGNKKDLRDEYQKKLVADGTMSSPEFMDYVTYEEGEMIATKVGAIAYIECSAKTMDGVDLVLPTAGRAALQTYLLKKRQRKCVLL